jgi:hypothetical protein
MDSFWHKEHIKNKTLIIKYDINYFIILHQSGVCKRELSYKTFIRILCIFFKLTYIE